MKKREWLLLLSLLTVSNLAAQTTEQKVRDAFLITRMAEKFHVQPRPLDVQMSDALYRQLLESLDEERIFFLQEDINKLSAFRFKLADEIKNRQPAFLQLLMSIYKQRLSQADTITDNICKKPFNFYVKEKFTVSEDTSYATSIAGMHVKLYKFIKFLMLSTYRNIYEYSSPVKPPSKKMIDSLEPGIRKSANGTIKRLIKRILQSPQGIENIIGNIYCQDLASCYDPHTAYFPADVKASFESMLGNKPIAFGFSLEEDEDGRPEIGRLQPGSAAYQSGQINEGDKITSIKWGNKDAIDVSGAATKELNEILSESGGDKVTLAVKKADGTKRQVTLHKEKLEVADDDDNKVKGFLLKGAKTVGYISLPDFYQDWENNSGVNGCANDVGKEVIKLKKENMQGLIIDLRYNGGGSLTEAIELAGIFIDAGPVAQLKDRGTKMTTLKDVNRGTVYDGPLVILVNRGSASASELVAGTLQDYNRALIVGSPTFGKATGQVVLPLDTSINLQTYNGKAQAASYVKLTTFRLYRVNGTTAQKKGVIPNIIIPDPTEVSSQEGEANEKFALEPMIVDANKYYTPLPPIHLTDAQKAAKQGLDSSAYFRAIASYVQSSGTDVQKTDISLLIDDFLQQQAIRNEPPTIDDYPEKNNIFTVSNNAYEKRRIESNKDLKEANDELKEDLLNDPYIKISYRVAAALVK